jgi:carboxylesterase type B
MQDSTYGPACHQVNVQTCDCPPANCPKKGSSRGGFLKAQTIGSSSEDCLFLDLYVPESALFFRNTSLPVIVWFHGGGYLFGAKDSRDAGVPLYNGTGILNAARRAGEEVIFVVCNYRLGAFGWLAGPSIEQGGVPNAGLFDQRLVLQWVQDFIHMVGGNRSRVSAWGESAGGGSILHHLVAENGERDPLFSRAVVQSPGFEWRWDRGPDSVTEDVYQKLSRMSGCKQGSIACLRAQDATVLAKQSQALYDSVKCEGKYSFGPATDGKLILRLPVLSYKQGGRFLSERCGMY